MADDLLDCRDSQMHESFEPWPQRVAQRGEPQHTTLAKDDVADVTLSQDSGGEDEDATLDSAPPAKKVGSLHLNSRV